MAIQKGRKRSLALCKKILRMTCQQCQEYAGQDSVIISTASDCSLLQHGTKEEGCNEDAKKTKQPNFH